MAKLEKSSKGDIHSKSFGDFMNEFISESDRAAVILGASKIETLLGYILDKHLLPSTSGTDDLLEGDSPLATFSARIKICHRLGLIDDHFAKLLNIFRKLRNGFAHEVTHSKLSSSAARDRVVAMADPFMKSEFFQTLVQKVADQMGRETADPGVVFRAVLAIFHLELNRIQDAIECTEKKYEFGVVELAMKYKKPD